MGDVTLTVNGEDHTVDADTTVADLVRSLGRDPDRPGVAVAVNGTVVPHRDWSDRTVVDDDQVEVVAAVQGGA